MQFLLSTIPSITHHHALVVFLHLRAVGIHEALRHDGPPQTHAGEARVLAERVHL